MIEILISLILILTISAYAFYELNKESNGYLRLLMTVEDDIKNNNSNIIHDYLKEIYEHAEIQSTYFIYTQDPVNYLTKKIISKFRDSTWYRFGGYITGVALIFTFLLIGVAVYKIGHALPQLALNSIGKENPMIDLGKAIEGLSGKFGISVVGLILSITYQIYSQHKSTVLYKALQQKLSFLRSKGKMHETLVLELTHIKSLQSERTNQLLEEMIKNNETNSATFIEEIHKLSKIEVSISHLSEQLSQDLGNMLDKQIGDKLTNLLIAQKNSTEAMATTLTKALSESLTPELNRVFQELGDKLPQIVMGGASQTTTKVAESFENIASMLPSLILKLEGVSSNLGSSVDNSLNSSKQINDEMMMTMNQLILKFNSISSESTASQSTVLIKLSETADLITKAAQLGMSQSTSQLEKSATTISTQIGQGALAFESNVNNLQQTLREINTFNTKLKESTTEQINGIATMLKDFRSTIELSKNQNSHLSSSVNQLHDITTKFSQMPSETANAAKMTRDHSLELKELATRLNDEYVKGVQQMNSIFSNNIKHIETQTQGISNIYLQVATSFQESLEPIQELSTTLGDLRTTLALNGKKL